jgi:hypothetical protein
MFLSAFVGMTFGELNATPWSQTFIVWCCKNTLNIITKLKSFQKKTNRSWYSCWRRCWLLFFIHSYKGVSIELHRFWFCHDDLMRCVGRISRKYAFDRPSLALLMAYVSRDKFHSNWDGGIGGGWFLGVREAKKLRRHFCICEPAFHMCPLKYFWQWSFYPHL